MIKAVVFDLDGLLIDSETVFYHMYQELLQPYGCGFSVKDYTDNYSGKTAIKNMESIIKRFQLPFSAQAGLEILTAKELSYLKQGISLKAGALELLKYLRSNHYKTALATSSIKERALSILQFHHIETYFDEMIFAHEVLNSKPDPDIFLKACKKLQIASEDCLVLEDSNAGIQAAFSAHIPVICIPDMRKPDTYHVNMTVAVLNSLDSVIDWLKTH